MSQLASAIRQLREARLYTRDLLHQVPVEDWYRPPAESVTHIAWQVGHLAFAQYALTLKRVRGGRPDDAELISAEFLAAFGRGSAPDVEQSRQFGSDAIREVFDRVHRQSLQELAELTEPQSLEPAIGPPHAMFQTKLGALQWCAQHEFIHAGQIALLRRLFGLPPLR